MSSPVTDIHAALVAEVAGQSAEDTCRAYIRVLDAHRDRYAEAMRVDSAFRDHVASFNESFGALYAGRLDDPVFEDLVGRCLRDVWMAT